MSPTARRSLFLIAGIVLILAPWLLRTLVLEYNRRSYTEPAVPTLSVAVTPVPTVTPVAAALLTPRATDEIRSGPIVVDLAHGNRLNRSSFQPLAAALSERGFGLRFWLSDVDPLSVQSFLAYPDQSTELVQQLADASALVVISPYFLWSPQEIAVVERFVADGGRLLLISDPDIEGDLARDINNLAEPFGAVFNDDYIYDTSLNDGNFVFVFVDEFLDRASALRGSRIALYGARSISGDVQPQALGGPTTLSSLRTGLSGLTTVAVAGLDERGTSGRVLIMSDFDVLTEPYVQRHDNERANEFVADFLAGAVREQTIVDFPNYLGKGVILVFGDAAAVDATLLQKGADLQRALVTSGRTLTLSSMARISETLAADIAASVPVSDLIYIGEYAATAAETTLFAAFGMTLTQEAVVAPTPSPAPSPTVPLSPTPTAAAELPGDAQPEDSSSPPVQAGEPVSQSASITATVAAAPPATPKPTSAPTPTLTVEVQSYVETSDGLRLLAAETVLLLQDETDGSTLLAILGNDGKAVSAGLERMLSRDYSGCIIEPARAICPYVSGEDAPAPPGEGDTGTPTPAPSATPAAEEEPASAAILLIDDNNAASMEEASEADFYLQALAGLGYTPDLWSTRDRGTPSGQDLLEYDWVIWSGAGYELSGPEIPELESVFAYINEGGRLTISSRRPFFGASLEEPSVIVDVVAAQGVPALVEGLPTDPIALPNGLPPVAPLQAADGPEDGPKVVMRRGPNSGDANAPVMFVLTDEEEGPSSTGARLLVLGMGISWFPEEYGTILVTNMAQWMLE